MTEGGYVDGGTLEVRVVANLTGFRAQLIKDLAKATKGVNAKVGIEIQKRHGLTKTKLRGVVDEAAKGVNAKIGLELSGRHGLTKTQLQTAVNSVAAGVNAKIGLDILSRHGLTKTKLQTAVDEAAKGVDANVGIQLNTANLKPKLAAATKLLDLSIKVRVDPDVSRLQSKLNALARKHKLTLPAGATNAPAAGSTTGGDGARPAAADDGDRRLNANVRRILADLQEQQRRTAASTREHAQAQDGLAGAMNRATRATQKLEGEQRRLEQDQLRHSRMQKDIERARAKAESGLTKLTQSAQQRRVFQRQLIKAQRDADKLGHAITNREIERDSALLESKRALADARRAEADTRARGIDTGDSRDQIEDLTTRRAAAVDVEANLEQLRGQLAELTRRRNLQMKVDVDFTSAEAKVAELARKRTIALDADLQIKEAEALLAEVTRERTAEIEVQAEVETARRMLAQAAEERFTRIVADPEIREAKALLDSLEQTRTVNVNAEADIAAARELLDETTRRRTAEIEADADVAGAEAILSEATRKRDALIEADADIAAAQALLVEVAQDRLVNIELDLEIAQAQAELDGLTAQREMHVDVDVEITAARARLDELTARREAKVQADADTAAAEAQLKLLTRARDVRIRANASQLHGALAIFSRETSFAEIRVLALSGAIAALVPLIAPIGAAAVGAAAGLAAMATAGLAGVGVLIAAFQGVGDAIGALNKVEEDNTKITQKQVGETERLAGATGSVAGAVAALRSARENAADSAVASAQRISAAERGVADALRGVSDAAVGVVDAERGIAQAQDAARRAQESLTEARRSARQAMEDLALQIRGGRIDQEQANIAQAKAKRELDKVLADPSATQEQRREAQLAYEEAALNVDELALRNKRLAEEKAKSDRQGVEGSDEVRGAMRGVADAQQGILDAQRRFADAQRGVADAQRRVADAERGLADARRAQAREARQSAESIASAQRGLASAQRSYGAALRAEATETTGSLDALRKAQEALTPAGFRFAQFIQGTLLPRLGDLQAAAANGLLPGLQSGIESMLPLFEKLVPFVADLAETMGNLFSKAGKALGAPFWQDFFNYMSRTAGPFLEDIGSVLGNVAKGFAGLLMAFEPVSVAFSSGMADMTRSFANWAAGLRQDTGFDKFVNYILEAGPRVIDFFGSLFDAIGKILQGLAPIGDAFLTAFKGLFDLIAATPAPVITAIAAAVIGLVIGLIAYNVASAGAAIAQAALNTAVAIFYGEIAPIAIILGIIVAAFVGFALALAALAAGMIYAYNESAVFRAVITEAFETVKRVLEDMANVALSMFSAFTGGAEDAKGKFLNIMIFIALAIEKYARMFETAWYSFIKPMLSGDLMAVGSTAEQMFARVASAERDLASATREADDAQKNLNDSMAEAEQQLKDLQAAEADLNLDRREGKLAFAEATDRRDEAQREYDALRKSGKATKADLTRAQRRVEQAQIGRERAARRLNQTQNAIVTNKAEQGIAKVESVTGSAKAQEEKAEADKRKAAAEREVEFFKKKAAEAGRGFGNELVKGVIEGIWEIYNGFNNRLTGWVGEFFKDIKELFGIASPSTVMIEMGKDLIQGLINGILGGNLVSAVGTFLTTSWTTFTNTAREKWGELKTAVKGKWDELRTELGPKFEEFKTKLGETWESAKTTASTKWGELKTNVHDKWTALRSELGPKLEELKTKLGQTWDSAKTTAATKWGELKTNVQNKWTELRSDLGTKFDNLKTRMGTLWTDLKTGAATGWSTLKTTVTSTWDTMWTTLGKATATGVTAVATAWSKLNTAMKPTVEFLVLTIVNSGIVDNFNNLTAPFRGMGVPKLTPLKLPPSWNANPGVAAAPAGASSTTLRARAGGPIRGPGTETSDSILARLSNDEHVWTAREVRGAGGHAAVEQLRAAARSGQRQVPGFWIGGGLTEEIIATARKSGVPFNVTSGRRPGSTSLSGGADNHSMGRAVDMASSATNMQRLAAWFYQKYNHLLELIHSGGPGYFVKNRRKVSRAFYGSEVPGHYDHVHVAMDQLGLSNFGVAGAVPADMAGAAGGGLEAFLRDKATAAVKALVGRIPGAANPLGKLAAALPQKVAGNLGAAAGRLVDSLPGGGLIGTALDFFTDKPTGKAGTPAGNKQIAQSMLAQFGFSAGQWPALEKLWTGESGWNHKARNPSSGAYGIPQSLPASKMASAGPDWLTNPVTQIKWGLNYIKQRYGNPANAYSFWLSKNPHWYDTGGDLQPGTSLVHNGTGRPEAVFTERMLSSVIDRLDDLARALAAQANNLEPAVTALTQIATVYQSGAQRPSGFASTGLGRPARDSMAAAAGVVSGGPLTVQVYPRANQSETEIARLVSRELAWMEVR